MRLGSSSRKVEAKVRAAHARVEFRSMYSERLRAF